ncbi:MAG: tRNA (guanosine(46)-N7)-methyltransferase TrmB [Lachnospiraceae bacterium]|nr:tRNA (guanosine(46)-N7)-methyltransferase TrmB [Lachnospiraceae bacterium]
MRLRNIPAARPAVEQNPYCIQDATDHKGCWRDVFLNGHPLRIELGMGKGRFILTQAIEHTDINFLGLERYESVMYRAVKRLESEFTDGDRLLLPNLRLICCDAAELAGFFAKGEVERIFLNFSDPWPKERHAKRRLTSHRFLAEYEKVLPDGGMVEFKTDNVGLFDFSREEITARPHWEILDLTDDLHALPSDHKLLADNIMTEYEEKFASEGKPIHKLAAVYHE